MSISDLSAARQGLDDLARPDLRTKWRRKVFVFGDRQKQWDDVLADARLLLAPGAVP